MTTVLVSERPVTDPSVDHQVASARQAAQLVASWL